MKKLEVFNGNNIELLKSYPDNYFDSVVTDPPYGLGKEPNAEQMLQAWITEGYLEVKGSGFMGKEWDAFVPQPIFWKEVFRVLKHGGHIVAFFGTRTYDWGVMAMRLAGFEVRDCIQWIYGSGFPKSHNIGKAIDEKLGNKRESLGINPNTRENSGNIQILKKNGSRVLTKGFSKWEGWGSALKPANEPIVLARKPLEKGLSIAENVLKYGTGGINIDGCRVNLEENYKPVRRVNSFHDGSNNEWLKLPKINEDSPSANPNGRFPANLILTHHPECECSAEINGNETIENWTCHEDCPIRIMDEQSGVLNKQGVSKTDNKSGWQNEYVGGNQVKPIERKLYLDKGGASRFFYVAKASKKERNKGLEGFEEKPLAYSNQAKAELKRGNQDFDGNNSKGHGNSIRHLKNFHPTIKPVALMRYLVRMITPLNGIVLDPFNGSGTTGVACKVEGFNYVGLELDPEYCKISEARIQGWEEEVEMPKTIERKEVKKESAEEIQAKNQLNLF
jgi:DNA modification methylase